MTEISAIGQNAEIKESLNVLTGTASATDTKRPAQPAAAGPRLL
jgi:hypothetical protein